MLLYIQKLTFKVMSLISADSITITVKNQTKPKNKKPNLLLAISVFCHQVMTESWSYENYQGHVFACYNFVCVLFLPPSLVVEERVPDPQMDLSTKAPRH